MPRTKPTASTARNADRPITSLQQPPHVTDNVARRAYDLYCGRGREHGHDVDDWLQAERDLQEATE